MNRSIRSTMVMAALAIGAATAGAAAAASTNVYLSVGVPAPSPVTVYARQPQPQPVYVPAPQPHPVYAERAGYGDEWRGDQERAWRRACRARPWNPEARYFPGQRVWRHGTVYVATGLSASVWNVNSPPEWTPNYWAATDCAARAWRGERREW